MPTLRTNIQKGKFSNYGNSIFITPTANTKYFENQKAKQPTLRGSFPKAVRWSFDDESLTNARTNYDRGLEFNRSAAIARNKVTIDASKTIATASFKSNVYSQPNFDGTAARRLAPEPKIEKAPKLETNVNMHAVKGSATQKRVISTAALSPMFLTLAKVAAAVVVVVAVMAFVRVGLTSATVSTGLNSQLISNKIDSELINKSALEVEDSTLGNTSRIRQAAADLSLVAPSAIETINLSPDVLAYDENKNVSLVESLNRVAQLNQ